MSENEKLKKNPTWIKELEDGKFEITVKDKKYIMVERNGRILNKCQRLAQNTDIEYESLLAKESLEDPKLTDEDFEELRGSIYMKLKFAVIYIYGLDDFL